MIRAATAADWPGVRDLLIELGRPDPGSDDDAHRTRYLSYLARGDTEAFVAEQEGTLVGFIDVEFRQRLNTLTPQAWVPDLIVTERVRSTGIGRALLATAREAARARDCWNLTLESARWRERAHAFYRREGMDDGGLSFSESLDGTPWPPPPPA